MRSSLEHCLSRRFAGSFACGTCSVIEAESLMTTDSSSSIHPSLEVAWRSYGLIGEMISCREASILSSVAHGE